MSEQSYADGTDAIQLTPAVSRLMLAVLDEVEVPDGALAGNDFMPRGILDGIRS